MQYFSMSIPLIVIIVVPLWLFGINSWTKKVTSKQNKQIEGTSFTVTNNKLAIRMGILLIVFSYIVVLLFPILYLCKIPDGPPIEAVVAASIVFGPFAVFSTAFTFGIKRWKIFVNEDKIIYVPIFKKCREYTWDDILCLKIKNQPYGGATVYKVYLKQTNKKAFSFSSFMVGGDKFAEILHHHGF